MQKPIKMGIDYLRDKNWNPVKSTRKGAIRIGNQRMPADLKRAGFETHIFECDNYIRINYGKKIKC